MNNIEISEKPRRKDPRSKKRLDYKKSCRRESRLEKGRPIKKHHKENFNMFDGLSVDDAIELSENIIDLEDE